MIIATTPSIKPKISYLGKSRGIPNDIELITANPINPRSLNE
jgi:hypothetical protein